MDKSMESMSDNDLESEDSNDTQYSYLLSAIDSGNVEVGEKASEIRINGVPLLHYAIASNRYEIVNYFLSANANVNCLNNQKQTPLIIAAKVGNINIVNLCISHGAKLDGRDGRGMTPIHYASMCGNIGVISLLTTKGANLDVRCNKGKTPLMVAAQENQLIVSSISSAYLQTVEWLLRHHCRILDQDSRGRTVLHWACVQGSTEIAKTIMDSKYGPQLVRTVDFTMQTPLDFVTGLIPHATGIEADNLRETRSLLYRFVNHRISYEMGDCVDKYAAFSFVPVLALLGIVTLIATGMFRSSIPSSLYLFFFIFAIITVLLWVYLCQCDPGFVLDNRGNLKELRGNNIDYRKSYKSIMSGERLAVNSICPTCEIERPIRCKHCNKCGQCVIRMDHHCITAGICSFIGRWINNCIGYKKYELLELT